MKTRHLVGAITLVLALAGCGKEPGKQSGTADADHALKTRREFYDAELPFIDKGDSETAAREHLRIAKKHLMPTPPELPNGDREWYRHHLEEIVRKYPDTEAGKEAKRLLSEERNRP
jgi:hypothetical protein